MNTKTAYIAIDLHHKNSVIGHMNQAGKYFGPRKISTGAEQLTGEIVSIPADSKQLVIEQSNMSHWAASILDSFINRLVICDPRYNDLVSSSPKNDRLDTEQLCELLRMDALKAIYHEGQMGDRRLFLCQVKEYESIRKNLTAAKRQLTARLRHWGYNVSLTKADYNNPKHLLDNIDNRRLRAELESKCERIAFLETHKASQLSRIIEAGKKYPEIAEFQKMSGAGEVSSHTYSAYIQNPHRFAHKGQLIKFSRLAVRKYSSDGRRLRGESLSKQGHGSLKNVSHVIWKAAMGSDNEVSGFYQASLGRTGDADKARLNTQRKILITLWKVWKNQSTYNPDKFYNPLTGDSTH